MVEVTGSNPVLPTKLHVASLKREAILFMPLYLHGHEQNLSTAHFRFAFCFLLMPEVQRVQLFANRNPDRDGRFPANS